MIGAIIGDIIGSPYEWDNMKLAASEFSLFNPSSSMFTDDSVMTVATAHAILSHSSYADSYRNFGRRYIAGYGSRFALWLRSDTMGPYESYGNGSAMRVSPAAYIHKDLENTLVEAQKTAEVTHNHPEGIKGAQATAMAIYMARNGSDRDQIKQAVADTYLYDLNRKLDDIRPIYKFDESCQGTVPEAIIAFLESESFEDAIRKAVSLGGDSDTLTCITGGIAEAFYKKIPKEILIAAFNLLPAEFIKIIKEFYKTYDIKLKG